MNKKIIFCVALLSVIFLSGCSQKNDNKVTAEKVLPQINKTDIAKEDKFLENLCNNGYETYFNEKLKYSIEVDKCGEYYSLFRTEVVDAPRLMIDRNGKENAVCGGMPGPVTRPTPEECKINCGGINLCLGIEIDCSKIKYKNTAEDRYSGADEGWYEAMKDSCYLQNAIRMNDKKFCNNISDGDLKERCPLFIKQ